MPPPASIFQSELRGEIARQGQLFLIVLFLSRLCLAPFVQVQAAADEAGERAEATQAVFHLEGFAAVKVIEVVGDAAVEVVRVHPFRPSVARLLLKRAAGEGEPGLIEIVALRVERRSPRYG